MSRSTFLTTNEVLTNTDLHHRNGLMTTNLSNETLPIVVQSSSATKTTNTSITRNNPRTKRKLRNKRRATGIRPADISLANISTESSANDDDEKEDNASTHITNPNESSKLNGTITSSSPSKPVVTVNRLQSSFENLSIPHTNPYIDTSSSSNKISRPDEIVLRRFEKQTSENDSSTLKERILALESIIHDKDDIIHDLQQKLDDITQDLDDAEQEIYKLHQDKLTLIKAFTSLQDNKPPSDRSIRSNFITRN